MCGCVGVCMMLTFTGRINDGSFDEHLGHLFVVNKSGLEIFEHLGRGLVFLLSIVSVILASSITMYTFVLFIPFS